MPELKSEPLSLPAPPTATHADALSQATPAMPQNGVQPLPGVFSERHARPFHASATFASPLESVPTAMQNVLRVQATPARTSPAVPFGSLSCFHAWPVHLSIALPTAMQNEADVQTTAARPAPGTPPRTRHACPSQRCAVEC